MWKKTGEVRAHMQTWQTTEGAAQGSKQLQAAGVTVPGATLIFLNRGFSRVW